MSASSNAEFDAILNIPGAMLAAPVEILSKSTSRLKTPRKQMQVVPVLDASIGIAAIRDRYQKDCCHGNARAAKLLSKLMFRYQADDTGGPRLRTYRYGSFWWEKSYEDWATELDSTVKQVRTDFAKLKEWGLAEARPLKVYEGKNAGKTVTHARVLGADGAASLSGWPDYSQMRIVLECPNGHPIATPVWASHSNAHLGIHKAKGEREKEKEKGKDFAAEKLAATSGHPEASTGATGKPGNVKTITPSSLEVLPPPPPCAAPPAPAPDAVKSVKPLKGCDLLESIWRTQLDAEHGMYCGDFTKEHRRRMNNYAAHVSKAGFDPADTLRKLLSPTSKVAWDKIGSRIRLNNPEAVVPLKPTLNYICTYEHLDVLITMMIERRKKDAAQEAYLAQHAIPAVPVAPKPKPEPVAAPVEYDEAIDWNARWAALKEKDAEAKAAKIAAVNNKYKSA